MVGVAEAAGYIGLSEPYIEIAGITVPHAEEDEACGTNTPCDEERPPLLYRCIAYGNG